MNSQEKSASHTHTHLTALCPGQPGWASTRKVKPIWILLQQETVSGSGISWTICKSAPSSRQITTPAPTTQFFTGRMPFLPPNQQCQSTEGLKVHQSMKSYRAVSPLKKCKSDICLHSHQSNQINLHKGWQTVTEETIKRYSSILTY